MTVIIELIKVNLNYLLGVLKGVAGVDGVDEFDRVDEFDGVNEFDGVDEFDEENEELNIPLYLRGGVKT